MKKVLLLFLIFFSIQAHSQILISLLLGDKLNQDGVEFGLEGGLNWTTISGLETQEYARKWNLGFYFDLRVKDQWSIYTGVLVKSNMGVQNLSDADLSALGVGKLIYDGKEISGEYDHTMSTFLVPVLMRYNFKNNIYVALGPQFGLAYKSWIEFNSDIDDKDIIIKDYNIDKIQKVDAGFSVATGYTMMNGTGWTLSAKYYYGLVDVYKDISGTKNSSFFINLGIPIGAGDPNKGKTDK